MPQGGTSKDCGPGFSRRPSLNVSVRRRGGHGGLGAGGPQALRGASAEVTVSSGSTGAAGVSSLPACPISHPHLHCKSLETAATNARF